MPRPKTGATQYLAQLELSDKLRAIKGLVVCNNWDLEPLDLLNSLALGCYAPSHEVLIVLKNLFYINSWDLEPLDLALGCYQPPPEV